MCFPFLHIRFTSKSKFCYIQSEFQHIRLSNGDVIYSTQHATIDRIFLDIVAINQHKYQDEEFPTVAYLVGKFFKYKENPEALYVHGHLQEQIKYRLETDREVGAPGLPVTIGASKINSYVLGYSGFATSYT